ncbi:MAG: glycosyl transferase family 90 [Phocaeicola sp.]
MMKIKGSLLSGKNSKFRYYVKNSVKLLLPNFLFRIQRENWLKSVEKRKDITQIWERVNYYCKLTTDENLPMAQSHPIGKLRLKGHKSVYFFDSYEYLRYFPKKLRWCYKFGDVRDIPPTPTIVKSRELVADNANSVLLNMDKVRHFTFLQDSKKFQEKKNSVIFRGDILDKQNRITFMNRWFDDADCDLGDVSKYPINEKWKAAKISLYDHLDYKFIIALEGNDVASNLKWVMSSNSLAIMPRPTCETWFMEGRLIPNYHYVEIKSDFSDLKEKMNYYINHPDEALQIISNAHEWVEQFQDKKREKIISLLVLDKYFKRTNPEISD